MFGFSPTVIILSLWLSACLQSLYGNIEGNRVMQFACCGYHISFKFFFFMFGRGDRVWKQCHRKFDRSAATHIIWFLLLSILCAHKTPFSVQFPSLVKIFPGQTHGWSIRYDVKDAHQVKGAEEAHGDMLQFYKSVLMWSIGDMVRARMAPESKRSTSVPRWLPHMAEGGICNLARGGLRVMIMRDFCQLVYVWIGFLIVVWISMKHLQNRNIHSRNVSAALVRRSVCPENSKYHTMQLFD